MDAADPIPQAIIDLLTKAYQTFNARDVEGALALMQPDVVWPNGMEGGYEHGQEAVRAYWTRQWRMIDPHVAPIGFEKVPDGRIKVQVHQLVRDLDGHIILDTTVHHVYRIEGGLVRDMEIRKPEDLG